MLHIGKKVVYFGDSSPWPWGGETDYRITNVTRDGAVILYYAWRSDPHVTVMRETVTLDIPENKDKYRITSERLDDMDDIFTVNDFYKAYPDGIIRHTRMDYLFNGAGKVLNKNALTNSNYGTDLFHADTAARYLLNIVDHGDKVKVKTVRKLRGRTLVQISFLKDNSSVKVYMVQPYGKGGIWIPQTAADTEDQKEDQ